MYSQYNWSFCQNLMKNKTCDGWSASTSLKIKNAFKRTGL